MNEQARIRVFISYSRQDTTFVDKLDVSLKSRGFDTWVDRRKIEGGQDWPDELQRAIERSRVLVLVLSPDSVASRNVRDEYRYALKLGLVVIPILYQAVSRVPMDLNNIEWVDFQSSYDDALTNLVNTLARLVPPITATAPINPPHQPMTAEPAHTGILSSDATTKEPDLVAPQPLPSSPALSLKELYDNGDAANVRGEFEQALIFFEQIVKQNPNYLNGRVARDLKQLQQNLPAMRGDRLRADARQARQNGEWRREITDWQAIMVLQPQNSDAKAAVDVAQHNQLYEDMYAVVGDRIKRGELDLARQTLKDLWVEAPYYGDPDKFAPQLRLTVPPFREADKAANRAREALRVQEARRTYSEKLFALKNPLFILPYILFTSCTLAVLAGLVTISHPIPTSHLGNSSFTAFINPYLAIGVVAIFASTVTYYLGYQRAIGVPSLVLTMLGSIIVAAAVTLFLAHHLPEPPRIGTYHFPYLGALRITTNTPWAFGGLFAVSYGVVGAVVGVVVGGVWMAIEYEDFFPAVGGGLLVGVCLGLISGVVIGITVAFWGWAVSGIIAGVVLSLTGWAIMASTEGKGWDILLLALPSSIAVLALVNWLVCWFPLGIDSLGALVWAIWALIFSLAVAGLEATITIWVRR